MRWLVFSLVVLTAGCGDDEDNGGDPDPTLSCEVLAGVICSTAAQCDDTLIWPAGPMSVDPAECEDLLSARCPEVTNEEWMACGSEQLNLLGDLQMCAGGVPIAAGCVGVFGG